MPSFTSLGIKTSLSLLKESEKQNLSDGLRLLLSSGMIYSSNSGIFHLMPLALKSIEKLTVLIDREMKAIGGSKILLANLSPLSLWKQSGRADNLNRELFRLRDNKNKDFVLSPTQEEVITSMFSATELINSYRQMPAKFYQISTKYRDELRPRNGLLRCREFLMKDMYTFDSNKEAAMETYKQVCSAYEAIFSEIELPVTKTEADVGTIGGLLSHEYQIPSVVGENNILVCKECEVQINKDIWSQYTSTCRYPSDCKKSEFKGTELAHTFYLSTHYSDMFDLQFTNIKREKKPIEMGCYGFGLTRLLGALCEFSSQISSDRLLWPLAICPYRICIVPLTSKDPVAPNKHLDRGWSIYNILNEKYKDDVVIDNRMHLSLSYKLHDSRLLGFPYCIVLSDKQETSSSIELIRRKFSGEEITTLDDMNVIFSDYLD